MALYFCIVSAIPILHLTSAAKLPSSFKKCLRNDPKFDGCLSDAIQSGIKTLSTGVPKLGLVGLEPLSISQLNIGRGKGPISLDLNFKNLKIHGITDVKITDQKTNLVDVKLECRSFNKQLILEGDYQVEGKILLLPIRGKGKANIILDNVDGYSVLTGVISQNNNNSYLHIKHFDYAFKPSRMRVKFDNLFNGEKKLSDTMNRILNDNWEEVLGELKPSFEEALAEVFKEYANRLYQKVSLEDIYPETESTEKV